MLPREADVLWQLALLDLRNRKFDAARDRFQKIALQNPNDTHPLAGIAQTLAGQSRFGEALSLLKGELKKSRSRGLPPDGTHRL